MPLNNYNYFSDEAMKNYMSVSQFKDFTKCEANALAKLIHLEPAETSTALLVGSYVDRYFEGTLEEFRSEHPEILKRDGTLKADYVQAEEIIKRIESDEMFMRFIGGRSQVVMTGVVFGYEWKIKVDSLHDDKIVDLKVMKDFEPIYVPGEGRQHFIEAWGYDIQGAIYQEVVRQNTGKKLPFYIAAATKEKVTDLAIFEVPQDRLDTALKIVEAKIDRVADVKNGFEKPNRCGRCDFCKKTKKLTSVIDYTEEIE